MTSHDLRTTGWRSYMRSSLIVAALLLAQTVLIFRGAGATVATKEEMTRVCENWLTRSVVERGSWAESDSPTIASVEEIVSDDGVVLARCYSILPTGFVVVPTLKEMQPVKAYSDGGVLDERQSGGFLQLLKDVLSERMTLYETRWGSLDSPQSGAGDGIFGRGQRQLWTRYTQESDKFKSHLLTEQLSVGEVGPLLTSSWHQREPYNNYCPEDGGGRTVVGCAATAMSQILNFWQWPASGYGDHEYFWAADACPEGGTAQYLSADFSDAYDWANMLDSCDLGCTPVEEHAVAELCYEAGISLGMNYGSCGSGAWPSPYAYHHYFKYAPDIVFEWRIDYDLEGWFSLIKNEIDHGRPIQYGVAWHAIVCDGYRDHGDGTYAYHMNYGWHDEFNTWFVLDSLYCYWQPNDLCPASSDHLWANIRPQTEPIITISGHSIVSDGDGDGHADVGETVGFNVVVSNEGWDVSNLVGDLTSVDPYVTVVAASSSYDALIPWAGQSQSASPYAITIATGCPDPHWATLRIDYSGDGGYSGSDTLVLFIGDTPWLSDDFEGGIGAWTSTSVTSGHGNQWHLETYRAHSGVQSWKMGGPGSANYNDALDAGLITPPFLLPESGVLTFWHWIHAEVLTATEACDGGIVMISTTDGPWSQLEPAGGYDYSIMGGANQPLAPGTPCYSGSKDWSKAVFDLSAYSGVVQLMFRFGSDVAETDEGWYIDDIEVYSDTIVYLPWEWDAVSTVCTSLGVVNNGLYARSGANLDYFQSGDCDDRYLWKATSVLSYYDTERGNVVAHSWNSPLELLPISGCTEHVPTQTTPDYEIYESGTMITKDKALGMEITWWAPSGTEDCHFVIQRKKVYNFGGLATYFLSVGDILDWDIPVLSVKNQGGYDAAYSLIYQYGNPSDDPADDCRDNTRRFGAIAMLGSFSHSDNSINTVPYGGHMEPIRPHLIDVGGNDLFDSTYLYDLMHTPGYSATPDVDDHFSTMIHESRSTFAHDDTLYVYSAMMTLLDGTLDDLRSQVVRAKVWAASHLGVDLSCCTGRVGDANGRAGDEPTISDISVLIDAKFITGTCNGTIQCMSEADVNQSGGTDPTCDDITISDISVLIDYLFITGSSLGLPECL